jgi:hypothetical protein
MTKDFYQLKVDTSKPDIVLTVHMLIPKQDQTIDLSLTQILPTENTTTFLYNYVHVQNDLTMDQCIKPLAEIQLLITETLKPYYSMWQISSLCNEITRLIVDIEDSARAYYHIVTTPEKHLWFAIERTKDEIMFSKFIQQGNNFRIINLSYCRNFPVTIDEIFVRDIEEFNTYLAHASDCLVELDQFSREVNEYYQALKERIAKQQLLLNLF